MKRTHVVGAYLPRPDTVDVKRTHAVGACLLCPRYCESEYSKMPDRQDAHPQLVGEYRLVRKLGGGGFGTVYLAEHVHEHTQVAVKVLNIRLTRSEDFKDFIKDFIKEASTTIWLHHPHIVPLLHFGISRDDLPYLVMEYAPNGTLRDRHYKGEHIPLPTIVSYVNQLASALQYAHDQRIIHRDVKPENMLIRVDGTLLMSDFGVAKTIEQSLPLDTQTLVGTPAYLAPEQYMGQPCFASDQYSLAVIVYEWICGVRPFQGSGIGLVYQHKYVPPPSLRDHLPKLPAAVEQVVFKALAKAPEDRFSRIQEFASALSEAVGTGLSPVWPKLLPPSGPLPKGERSAHTPTLNTGLYNANPLASPEQAQSARPEPGTSLNTPTNTDLARFQSNTRKTNKSISSQSILPAYHTSPSETPQHVILSSPQKRRPGSRFLIISLIVFLMIALPIPSFTLFMKMISLMCTVGVLIVTRYIH